MSAATPQGNGRSRPAEDRPLKDRYWLRDPLLLPVKLSEAVSRQPALGEVTTIGKTFSGRAIQAVRFGSGPRKLVIIGGVHGWETVTTNSLYALVSTLFSGRSLDGEDTREWAAQVARDQTIYIRPQVSVDVAARMYRMVPEGYFPRGVGMETEADWTKYVHLINDPYERFTGQKIAGYFPGFTPEQVATWRQTGKELGLRWSDQGLDVWFDFEEFVTPEARAVRDFILKVKPDCVFELHGHEGETFVTAPTPHVAPERKERQVFFGKELLAALKKTRLPVHPEPHNPYLPAERPFLPNWVDREVGALTVFAELQMYRNRHYEVNLAKTPVVEYEKRWMPSQGQVIRMGWTLCDRLIELGQTHGYK